MGFICERFVVLSYRQRPRDRREQLSESPPLAADRASLIQPEHLANRSKAANVRRYGAAH